MDSKALLDYALFQLTPTRTRCDLVVFSGGSNEKLVSGLVEPFISHLKFAKDQISKGGYSITIRPPPTIDPSWFTKATFERFVHFISTPEILERSVQIEREILQIESSIQSNESTNTHLAGNKGEGLSAVNGIPKKSTYSSLSNGEVDRTDDVEQQNDCKIHLQHHLDNRKVLLQKEQAMAYARALVTGFGIDHIDDLLCFADAFGAFRLRKACINFKELWKKRSTDHLWNDEVAAMEASFPSNLTCLGAPGIIIPRESSAPSQNVRSFHSGSVSTGTLKLDCPIDASSATQAHSDSKKDENLPASYHLPPTSAKVHVQMPFLNQIPQYLFNLNISAQQMSLHQGHTYPTMHPVPPYYPGNLQWPPKKNEFVPSSLWEAQHHHHQKSMRKEKSLKPKEPYSSEGDKESESRDSDSGNVSVDVKHSSREQLKRQRKKSAKTIVIRNINHIHSKREDVDQNRMTGDSSSIEDDLTDEDFKTQKKVDAVRI